MTLELSEREAHELDDALRLHLGALIAELARTDDRSYRVGLRDSYDRLRAVRARLEALVEDRRAVSDRR